MENIRLAQTRDLGQTIGDPFLFARDNFKFFVRSYLYYSVPPLIVAVVIMAFGFKSLFSGALLGSRYGSANMFANLGAPVLIAYFLFILVSFFQQFYVSEFMVLKENNDVVTNTEVIERLKSDWKNILVTTLFLIGFAVLAVGLILLVFASSALVGAYVAGFSVFLVYLFILYAAVPMSNLVLVRLRERLGIFASLIQAFRIASGNWWKTFIAMLVVLMVFYSLVILFLIPFYVIVFVAAYHATSAGISPSLSSIYLNPVSEIIITITTFATFFLQNIISVFVGINYFSLSEKHSNFHLLTEINSIGEREDKNVRRQEGEY